MINIINELNLENGSNHKIAVLKKYSSNTLLQELLKMTYDKVAFTYGISMKNIPSYTPQNKENLDWALELLAEEFATRNATGNDAIKLLTHILTMMSAENADIIEKVIKRDLRINMGRSNINKVFKGLITKPVYCRCDIYTTDKIVDGKKKKGTANGINFPAIIQLKADGTYRELSKEGSDVNSISRSGEAYSYPAIETSFAKIKDDGYMTGELTVRLDDALLEKILPKLIKSDDKNGTKDAERIVKNYNDNKEANSKRKKDEKETPYILPRSIGNGLINSDDVPFDNLVYEVWDFITPEDYTLAGLKDKKNPPKVKYIDRFNKLKSVVAEMDADITLDGKRNVLVRTSLFSIDPHVGLELDYDRLVFLRLGMGNMLMIPDFEQKNSFNFQPSLGLGIHWKNFTIDYALTDIADQSIALYSNIFSLRYSFNLPGSRN